MSVNKHYLTNNDRNALLVLLKADASRAGFDVDDLVTTIDDCDRGCTTTPQGTRGPLASCALTDRLAELSQATYDPSQQSLQGSTNTARLLSRIRDVSLVLQAEHSCWVTEISPKENKLEDLLKDAHSEVETQGVDPTIVAIVAGRSAGRTLAGFVRRMSR